MGQINVGLEWSPGVTMLSHNYAAETGELVTSGYIRMVHENSLHHFHREHTGRRSPGSGRIPQDTSRRNLKQYWGGALYLERNKCP